jgi:hypothetical protein
MIRAWSKLRPLSKLDQLAETIIKTAFIMSEDHHVVTSYVEHKGANFRVANNQLSIYFPQQYGKCPISYSRTRL